MNFVTDNITLCEIKYSTSLFWDIIIIQPGQEMYSSGENL